MSGEVPGFAGAHVLRCPDCEGEFEPHRVEGVEMLVEEAAAKAWADGAALALLSAADDIADMERIGNTQYAELGEGELDRFRLHPLGSALSNVDAYEARGPVAEYLRERAQRIGGS